MGSFKNNINKTMDTVLTNEEVNQKILEKLNSVLDFKIFSLKTSKDINNDIDYIFVEANELEISCFRVVEEFKKMYDINLEFIDYEATDKHCNFIFKVIYR